MTVAPTQPIEPALLNTRQVAQLTGMAPKTIKRWVALGDFPSPASNASNGKYYRWHRSVIVNWLNRQKPRV